MRLIPLMVLVGCASSPAVRQQEEGFVPLFDGQTLNGWQGAVEHYKVENGTIVYRPELRTKDGVKLGLKDLKMLTAKEYGDFVFRFEFKLTEHSNSGIGVRTPAEGDAAYVGMEIQLIDVPHWPGLMPYQVHGSVYGVVPAKPTNFKPLGEWNVEEIDVKGSRVRVTVNGDVVVDADLDQITPPYIDGKDHPGLKRRSGHLALLGHTDRVEFRNLRVKEM
jgi:hypothetical protein